MKNITSPALCAILLFSACSNNDSSETQALSWLIESPVRHYNDLALVRSAADAWGVGLQIKSGEDCRVRIHITDPLCSSALKYTERFSFICPVQPQIKRLGQYLPDHLTPLDLPGDVFIYNGHSDAITKIILMHEIGHVLGFGHSLSVRDLMFPQIQNLKQPSPEELHLASEVYNQGGGLVIGALSGRMSWIIEELELCYAGSAFGRGDFSL